MWHFCCRLSYDPIYGGPPVHVGGRSSHSKYLGRFRVVRRVQAFIYFVGGSSGTSATTETLEVGNDSSSCFDLSMCQFLAPSPSGVDGASARASSFEPPIWITEQKTRGCYRFEVGAVRSGGVSELWYSEWWVVKWVESCRSETSCFVQKLSS